jgi:hypothetical protein
MLSPLPNNSDSEHHIVDSVMLANLMKGDTIMETMLIVAWWALTIIGFIALCVAIAYCIVAGE